MMPYSMIFKIILYQVVLVNFVPIGFASVVKLQTESILKDLTINFFWNLQNRNYPVINSTNFKAQTLDDVSAFQKSMLRKLRDVKRQYNQHTNYGPSLQQMIDADVYPFKRFEEYGSLKLRSIEIKDISIFPHKYVNSYSKENNWFAAIVIENIQYDNSILSIHNFFPKTNNWKLMQSENIVKTLCIKSLSTPDGTLLVLAHASGYRDLSCRMSVFLLDDNNKLNFVQDLNMNYFSNLALWKSSDSIFLMPAIDHVKQDDADNVYETNNPLYIWKGSHFDIFNYIPTKNAKSIAPFQIGTTHFISIANHQNNYGEKNIFSEIFKYDPERNEFIPLQKLATNGAIETIFFGFQWSTFMEAFIMMINKYESHKEFYTTSVLYKYDKGIFIPFQKIPCNDIIKWLPITANNGEFLILGVSNRNDIKIFQYNGWNFIEIYHNFKALKDFAGNTKVNVFVFYDNPVLTITNNINGESTNYFYKPIFGTANPIKEIKNKLYEWCEKILVTLSCFGKKYFNTYNSDKHMMDKLKRHERYNNNNSSIILASATIDRLETKSVYSDDFEFNYVVVQNLNDISSSLRSQLTSARSLQEILKLTMSNNIVKTNSMKIDRLHLSCSSGPCNLKNVKLSNINEKDIDYYQKEIVYVENGFHNYKEIVIDSLNVKYKINLQFINNKLLENIRKRIQTIVERSGIIVKGTLTLDKGFSLSGRLENIKINDETILLKDGNQHLKGQLFVLKLKSNILEVPQINDIILDDFKNSIDSVNKTFSSTSLRKLTVDDILLDNEDDIRRIRLFALKLNGDQIIKGKFSVNHLHTKQVEFNNDVFKTNLMEKFVKISNGNFEIDQDLHFQRFGVKNLLIKQRLNNVPIKNDKLDVLLVNSSEEQRVIGDKIFENVELMGPVNLMGRINLGSLDKKNPITMIEEPLILTGDFSIMGNVSIESRIVCDNLINEARSRSIKHLQQRGLKLSDSIINIPLTFTQPLEMKNMNCDTVNGIDPSSWVTTSRSNEAKMVTGKKIFIHDLEIKGNCSIPISINEQKSSSFRNILNVNANQEISGQIFISNITTKGLNCNSAKFGGKHYGTMLNTERSYTVFREIIANNVAIIHKSVFSDTTEVSGNVNNWNVHYVVNDTVLYDEDYVVLSNDLTMEQLKIVNLYKLSDVLYMDIKDVESWMDWEKEIYINGPLYLDRSLNVKRSVFGLSIAGISKADFGYSWLLSTEDQIIHGKFNFDSISCSSVHIESRIINDMDIVYTYENAIWLDENSYLKNVRFAKNPVIKQNLNLDGFINYVKRPSDFILKGNYPKSTLYISGYKILQKKIYVNEKIYPVMICKIPLDKFCSLMHISDEYSIPNINVKGNLKMKNEPIVRNLNKSSMYELMETIWFTDKIFNINSNNIFKNVVFKSYIIVKGLINQVDLYTTVNNYVSKSTNQDIENLFNIHEIFADIMFVKKETITDNLKRGDEIQKIYYNTLSVNELQTIVQFLKFDTIIGNIYLQNKVNDLNITTDMMRISSASNIVYANKRFTGNVSVNNVFTKYIQDIEMDAWKEYSAKIQQLSLYPLKNLKTLKTATIRNLNVFGYINDKSTNYLLDNEETQIITGKITFIEDEIFFNNCFVKQKMNGIDIKSVFDNMILKSSKNAIVTWPKTFASSIFLKNVIINDSNFAKTISAINQSDVYNDYKYEFHNMANYMTNLAQNYYENCAKIIFDMELIQVINGDIKTIKSVNEYMAIVNENSNGLTEIHFFKWNTIQSKFINDKSIAPLFMNEDFSELFIVTLRNISLLYVETMILSEKDVAEYKGSVYLYNGQESYVKIQDIAKMKTTSVIGIEMESNFCITLIKSTDTASIYCLDDHLNIFQPRGVISIKSSTEVYTMKTSDALYLIVRKSEAIDVHHWIQNDNQKLSLVQSLPTAICSAFVTWKNLNILALGNSEKIVIYRFDSNVQRFVEIQVISQPPGIEIINLDVIDDHQVVLSSVIKGQSSRILLYKYDGMAKFQLHFVHYLPNTEILMLSTVTETNAFVIAIASQSDVTIYRSKFRY